MLRNLQIVSIYFNSSIQNDKFYLFLFYRILNFDMHVCACMQVHVHVRAWMEVRGRTLGVQYYHSLTPQRQPLTECGAVPLPTPSYLASQQPQGSTSSSLFLPPPTPTPSAVVTGVCSDVRVEGNWTQVLKLLSMEPFPKLLITKF